MAAKPASRAPARRVRRAAAVRVQCSCTGSPPTSPAASRNSAAAVLASRSISLAELACAIRSSLRAPDAPRNCICRCRPACRSTDASPQIDGGYPVAATAAASRCWFRSTAPLCCRAVPHKNRGRRLGDARRGRRRAAERLRARRSRLVVGDQRQRLAPDQTAIGNARASRRPRA